MFIFADHQQNRVSILVMVWIIFTFIKHYNTYNNIVQVIFLIWYRTTFIRIDLSKLLSHEML